MARRFKITKTGKVLHRASFGRHLQSKKKKSTKRRHKILQEIFGKDKINIKKLLGR